MPIITDITNLKSREQALLKCENCKCEFFRPKNRVQRDLKRKCKVFCSRKCKSDSNRLDIILPCKLCDKPVLITQRRRLSGNTFCSQSCSAKYSNSHKTIGTRRSKLEQYTEEKLKQDFPRLRFECNNVSIINSELDFYFPDLRFAIELNGIVHYEPIYGTHKFDRIRANDSCKATKCRELGIELAVIDVSGCRRHYKQKDIYYNLISELIQTIIHRVPGEGLEPPRH